MSKSHEIDCRQCGEKSTLEDRVMFDGCCWACGAEIDLEDYLARAMDERDKLRAEFERLSRFEAAYNEWQDKTEWVQTAVSTGALPARYLGMHRADVLRAEVEALRKDAERYRWLRNPDQDVALVLDKMVSSGVYEYRAGDELDAAIDAAMAAKEVSQ